MGTIGQLSDRIANLAKIIEDEFETKGVKSPTINDESLADLSSVNQETILELAETSRELEHLVLGPRQSIGMMALSVHDASSLGVIIIFDIPKLVPIEGSVAFAELSALCGLDEDRLTRILRYAMINFIFREEPAGHVRHTAFSAHLAQSPSFCDFLNTIATVLNPANTSLPLALRRFPKTELTNEAAHGVARCTDKTFYDWLDENPQLRNNFDKGMEGISRGGQRMQDTDLRAYPWHKLPDRATIVDVGGSRGHFARDLAETYTLFSVIVQDLPRVIHTILEQNLDGAKSNVSYHAHNFFNEQPIKGADVYFMRHIFHNHPDIECIKILKALLPALKPGAIILVSEYIIPPDDELPGGLRMKPMRQMDLMTMALFNAKERTKQEYSELFHQASSKLCFQGTHQVPDDPGSCVFEAIFQG